DQARPAAGKVLLGCENRLAILQALHALRTQFQAQAEFSCCALLFPAYANGAVMPIPSENDQQVSRRLIDRGSRPRIAARRPPAGGGWRLRRSCRSRDAPELRCPRSARHRKPFPATAD